MATKFPGVAGFSRTALLAGAAAEALSGIDLPVGREEPAQVVRLLVVHVGVLNELQDRNDVSSRPLQATGTPSHCFGS